MRNKGITLVALVITIIVLIILAGISITILLGEDGLIDKSKKGANDYRISATNELETLDAINEIVNDIVDGSNTVTPLTPKKEQLLTREFESDDNDICIITSSSVWNGKAAYKAFSTQDGFDAWVANGYAPQWLNIKFKSGTYKITKLKFISYDREGGDFYDISKFDFQGRNSEEDEFETIQHFEGVSSDTLQTQEIETYNYYNEFRIKALYGSGYSGISSLEIYGIPQ